MNVASTKHDGLLQEDVAPPRPAPAVLRGLASPPPAAELAALLKRQEAVVAMGRRAIAPPETSLLLQDAASLMAEMFDAECSVVAELSPDGATLLARATLRQPHNEKPPPAVRELSAAGDQSLAAYALQVAHPVVVDDLLSEARFHDRFLGGFGIRSALAMPLRLLDRAFGALIAGSAEPRRFDARDVPFAEAIGHLAGTSIARSQAEQDSAEAQSLMLGLLQTVEALVTVLNAEGQILCINEACERTTGFCLADLRGRPIWSAFATPAEAELYRNMLDRLRQGETHVVCEGFLLTKHAQQRRVRWSCSALPAAADSAKTILATGIDITEQHMAEQAMPAVEQAAQAEPIPIALPGGMWSRLLCSDDALPACAGGESTAPSALVPGERRRQPRRAYPYRQRVAPILNGRLPSRDRFREVQCHDIAAGGIAFLSEKRPESDLLVVALGSPPRLTYLIAQVVHVTPVVRNGVQTYRIGCKYTGRASYSFSP